MKIIKTIKNEYLIRRFLKDNFIANFDRFDYSNKAKEVILERTSNLQGKYISTLIYRDIKFKYCIYLPNENSYFYILQYHLL